MERPGARAATRWSPTRESPNAAVSDRYGWSGRATTRDEAANAIDRAGRADSAIALYERALGQPTIFAGFFEVNWYPFALRRLGELYEARGDRDHAVEYYEKFIDLWRDADAELQPQVEDARRRLAGLVGERG